MTGFKKIILCADDFGLNSGISQGILQLVQQGRLSAVSCIVNTTAFKTYAHKLVKSRKNIKVGLHFNLTEGNFLSHPEKSHYKLEHLLFKSHTGLLRKSFIDLEFRMQLNYFIQHLGKIPDFIDGHQHVHQFPGIRQVILNYYEQYLKIHKTAIRSTFPHFTLPQFQFKGKVLAITGGRKLHTALKKFAIPHNFYFSGIYDFAPASDYRFLFRQWLATSLPGTLIMCHPGKHSNELDVINHARTLEMNYFLSDEFLQDCQEFACCI